MKKDQMAYDLQAGAMAVDYSGDVSIDRGAMAATCTFSTPAVDRVGDIVEMSGIYTANHQRNPVIMWAHGKTFDKPIGRTVDPAGRYTVYIEDVARQTTYFSQTLLEAEQIFDLVCEGIICTNSIGFDVIKAQPIYTGGRKGGLHILECDLLEVSWTAVPINPEACTKAIHSLCCGRPLAQSIRSTLEPFAIRRNAWAHGVALEKCYDMRAVLLKSAEFEESKHPRDHGKFSESTGGSSAPDDEPDDTEDDEPEEVDEEQDADDEAHNNAAEVGAKLADKRPDTILGANVELRSEGDYVLSLATGEPVHVDDYDSDLSSNLQKIIPNIKKLDDLHAINAELAEIDDSERIFYNGMKPDTIDATIDDDLLNEINAQAVKGNTPASIVDLNEKLEAEGDYRLVPDGSYMTQLIPAGDVASYFDDDEMKGAGLSNAIDAMPESERTDTAARWNDFFENADADTRLFKHTDGSWTAMNQTILDDPEALAEYITDQYDASDAEIVEWFNDLMAERGTDGRLVIGEDEDGDPIIEIEDGPETSKGLRFWLTKSFDESKHPRDHGQFAETSGSDNYESPQHRQNVRIVERLNNPKPARKLSPKQAKEAEAKELHAKLGAMSKEDKHKLARSHGIDPEKYPSEFNLNREIISNPEAKKKLLAKD